MVIAVGVDMNMTGVTVGFLWLGYTISVADEISCKLRNFGTNLFYYDFMTFNY